MLYVLRRQRDRAQERTAGAAAGITAAHLQGSAAGQAPAAPVPLLGGLPLLPAAADTASDGPRSRSATPSLAAAVAAAAPARPSSAAASLGNLAMNVNAHFNSNLSSLVARLTPGLPSSDPLAVASTAFAAASSALNLNGLAGAQGFAPPQLGFGQQQGFGRLPAAAQAQAAAAPAAPPAAAQNAGSNKRRKGNDDDAVPARFELPDLAIIANLVGDTLRFFSLLEQNDDQSTRTQDKECIELSDLEVHHQPGERFGYMRILLCCVGRPIGTLSSSEASSSFEFIDASAVLVSISRDDQRDCRLSAERRPMRHSDPMPQVGLQTIACDESVQHEGVANPAAGLFLFEQVQDFLIRCAAALQSKSLIRCPCTSEAYLPRSYT